jgi:hypothetical protein
VRGRRIFLGAFLVGLLISMAGIAALAVASPPMAYPRNGAGQTYGSAARALSPGEEPELVAAIGLDGTRGYVYRQDLAGEMPRSPEEALAAQRLNELRMAGAAPGTPVVLRTIPLYDVDGKTVIGEFRIVNAKPR